MKSVKSWMFWKYSKIVWKYSKIVKSAFGCFFLMLYDSMIIFIAAFFGNRWLHSLWHPMAVPSIVS